MPTLTPDSREYERLALVLLLTFMDEDPIARENRRESVKKMAANLDGYTLAETLARLIDGSYKTARDEVRAALTNMVDRRTDWITTDCDAALERLAQE